MPSHRQHSFVRSQKEGIPIAARQKFRVAIRLPKIRLKRKRQFRVLLHHGSVIGRLCPLSRGKCRRFRGARRNLRVRLRHLHVGLGRTLYGRAQT